MVPVACPGPRSSLAHRQDAHLSRPSASQLERSRARCRPWRAPGSLRRRQSVSSPACQSHDPSGARGREAGGMTDPLIRQRIHPAFRGHTERLLGPLPASPLLLCSAGWRAHWPSRRRWTFRKASADEHQGSLLEALTSFISITNLEPWPCPGSWLEAGLGKRARWQRTESRAGEQQRSAFGPHTSDFRCEEKDVASRSSPRASPKFQHATIHPGPPVGPSCSGTDEVPRGPL